MLIYFVIFPWCVHIHINFKLRGRTKYPRMLERHLYSIMHHKDLPKSCGCKKSGHFISVEQSITYELLEVRLIHIVVFILFIILMLWIIRLMRGWIWWRVIFFKFFIHHWLIPFLSEDLVQTYLIFSMKLSVSGPRLYPCILSFREFLCKYQIIWATALCRVLLSCCLLRMQPYKSKKLDFNFLNTLFASSIVNFRAQVDHLVIFIKIFLTFDLKWTYPSWSESTQAAEYNFRLSHFYKVSSYVLYLYTLRILNQYWELYLSYLLDSIRRLIYGDANLVLAFQIEDALGLEFLADANWGRYSGHVTWKGKIEVENMTPRRNVRELGQDFSLPEELMLIALNVLKGGVEVASCSGFMTTEGNIFKGLLTIKGYHNNTWSRECSSQIENNLTSNIFCSRCEDCFCWDYT